MMFSRREVVFYGLKIIFKTDLPAYRHSLDTEGVLPQPIDIPGVLSTSPRVLLNASGVVAAPCGYDCHPPRNKSAETPTHFNNAGVPQQQQQNSDTEQLCNRTCRLNRLSKKGLIRHNMYISRVQVRQGCKA
ncbi:hypothetical protein E2C01_089032 [Portunus trituberculatus]|uniref:Uncharacterized protein n=1 Tax=Portunus trituberculatus TaxID=210409 RepID=A0A5B7JL51_PORTR|nr:hypothetical protein [Portunus trituberculatus]